MDNTPFSFIRLPMMSRTSLLYHTLGSAHITTVSAEFRPRIAHNFRFTSLTSTPAFYQQQHVMPLISSLLRRAHHSHISLRANLNGFRINPINLKPRFASSAALAARSQKSANLYPATINVYRSGTPALLGVGLTRMSTIVIFLIGTGIYAPGFYFSDQHSNLWIPACIAISAFPMLAVSLLTGPMVHGIRVTLPEKVRRSGKEGLRRWAVERRGKERVQVELQFMRWSPWPRSRIVEFGELRRLRPTLSGGIANLQHIPTHEGTEGRKEMRLADGLMKRWMARFYVSRDQKVDRAAVPGVWEGLWDLIPFEGKEEGGKEIKKGGEGNDKEKMRAPVPPMGSIGRP